MSKVAFAGSYRLSYSGGQVESVFYGPGGGTMTYPYWWTELGYGGIGGIDGSIFPNGGTSTCSGAIAVDFVWDNGGNPNDLPPQAVILEERSMARYGAWGSGSCSNGLGHPPVPIYGGAISEGTRYTIRNNPGPQFQLTCTPSANVQVEPLGAGYAQVWYSATLTPVVMNVRGTTRANDKDNVLIGQGIQCTVSAGSYRLDNFKWSSSGSYFGSVEWGPPLYGGEAPAYRRVWPPNHHSPNFNFYYDRGALNPGEREFIQCSVDINIGSTYIGSATVFKYIWVWIPYYEMRALPGVTSYYPDATDPIKVKAGQGDTAGMAFIGRTETPNIFRTPFPGVWSYSQLITVNRRMWVPGRIFEDTCAPQSLDNQWPYPPDPPWLADYEEQVTSDSPAIGLFEDSYRYIVNDRFFMMQVYLPPVSLAGTGSEWVPLKMIIWEWNANDERTPPQAWPGPDWSLPIIAEIDLPTSRVLNWEEVYRNVS